MVNRTYSYSSSEQVCNDNISNIRCLLQLNPHSPANLYLYLSCQVLKKLIHFESRLQFCPRMSPTLPHVAHLSIIRPLSFTLTLLFLILIGRGLCSKSDLIESTPDLPDSARDVFLKNFHVSCQDSVMKSKKDIKIGQENNTRRHPLPLFSKVI